MRAYDTLNALSDERLAQNAAGGDSSAMECLILRYSNTINAEASKYYAQGFEKDDIVQEGMIGLYNAVLNYNPQKNSFKTFACLCISRKIITLLKSSSRQKHIPLNAAFSLDGCVGNDGSVSYIDCIEAPGSSNPEEIVIGDDSYKRRLKLIKSTLSTFEKKVLNYLIDGLSYREISERMHRDAKSIDNAIQRIRKKSELFSER